MSIINRLRKAAWISALLLGSASAYGFVCADCEAHVLEPASPTRAASSTLSQPWTGWQAEEAATHRRQVAAMSRAQRLAWGQRVYRRSCIHCHGVQPAELAHDEPETFTRAVLNGDGAMPALGFKLSATEVQVARLYVARCQTSYSDC